MMEGREGEKEDKLLQKERERGEGERESLLACLAEENDSQQSLEPV